MEAQFEETTAGGSAYTQRSATASAAWFALYTLSHHEKRVAEQLAQRRIESFLPLYPVPRRWKNRTTVNLELPLFPGYLFVRIERRERGRVVEVPGVVSLLGFGKDPAPLPDFEIESMRSGLGRRKISPHPYLVVGERIRIKRGAMTGMEGILVREKNHCRMVLTLDLLRQSVAVEVDADDLEPVVLSAHGHRIHSPVS